MKFKEISHKLKSNSKMYSYQHLNFLVVFAANLHNTIDYNENLLRIYVRKFHTNLHHEKFQF